MIRRACSRQALDQAPARPLFLGPPGRTAGGTEPEQRGSKVVVAVRPQPAPGRGVLALSRCRTERDPLSTPPPHRPNCWRPVPTPPCWMALSESCTYFKFGFQYLYEMTRKRSVLIIRNDAEVPYCTRVVRKECVPLVTTSSSSCHKSGGALPLTDKTE